MEFRRRGLRKFISQQGDFTIRRATGPAVSRKGLWVSAPDHDYDVLVEGQEIWLLDGEREVAYAKGFQNSWDLILGERTLKVDQPKIGVSHSFIREDNRQIGQFVGSGFPLRALRSEGELGISEEHLTFLAAVVLTGWRESDRGLFYAGSSGSHN
jgi:hypothetical protein